MVRTIRSGAACALLLAASVAAHAAGLGKLTVNSALGQPLNAEIDLVSIQPGEVDALSAHVASPESFRDARIEYSSSLRLLRFSIDKRASGQPYLKVTSVGPINEPFVDVLIEVTWPAGRIQREYPILLDPPGYAQGRLAAPAAVAAAPPAPATSSSSPETPPASPAAVPSSPAEAASGSGAPSASAEMAASTGSTPSGAGDTYGPVKQGDTLSKIAGEVKPSNVSLEQMLVALYRENQGAFSGNNMNRLKTGPILKVPSADEVARLEPAEVGKEVRAHVADWKTYREQLGGGVASIPARSESSNASSGRVASAAVAAPRASAGDSKDVLKLSNTEGGKAAAIGKGGGASQDRLNALQEEVIAKDKALKESQSRVADLERQIRDMQRLLELKAGAPAKPDSKLAVVTPPPAKPAEATKPPEAPKPQEAPKAVEAPKPAEAPKVAEAPKPAEAPKVAEAPKPAEAPKVAEAPKPAAPKAPPPPPSFVDELMDNPVYLALGGTAIGAVVLGGFLLARRRKQRAEAGPSSATTSAFPSDLKPNTTTGKSGGGLVDTGNSSFLTDFDKTGPGTIDTDEVDPVAEAEVYIAYGRDAQAEEILKEAMARDKNRHEIALKLLEIYHARKSSTAFGTVAKELRSAVGENHPLWQKAAAMGAQIDPANPLYAAAASGTATFSAMSPAAAAPAPHKPDVDFDLETSAAEKSASASSGFDLDLDAQKASAAHEPSADSLASGIDFDLPSSAPSASEAHRAEAAPEDKPAFDFDLSGLDFPSSKPAGTSEPEAGGAKPAVNLADLSLESPAADGAGEAVGTKLELAKAYLEIGDKDGAREILQEVAKEGSPAQKEEAKKLISSL